MRRQRLRLKVGLAALAWVSAAFLVWLYRYERGWQHPSTFTHLPEQNADVFFVNAPGMVDRGPPRLVVVRLSGPVALVPHHYRQGEVSGPVPIEAWAQALGAAIVFNAGQFDERFQHLGWLKASGAWLSAQRKPAWMGVLVSQPLGPAGRDAVAATDAPGASGTPGTLTPLPWAQLIDLERDPPGVIDHYAHAVQSMMLVDEAAKVRVRRTDRAACRTVVAEDKEGRILIVATEGAVTLQALATWLPSSGLGIVRAMNLDGGVESQLAINTPELRLTLYGQYGAESSVFEAHSLMVRAPLPAVVAVESVHSQDKAVGP